jgi:ArsR family transcriptional regulator
METKLTCPCCQQHQNQVENAMENMPQANQIDSLSSFFKMMGDPTRIKMMYIMAEGEVCVQDLACALGVTKSAVSHQLSGLKDNRIVKSRREGKNVYYSIDDDHVSQVLSLAMTHIRHQHE